MPKQFVVARAFERPHTIRDVNGEFDKVSSLEGINPNVLKVVSDLYDTDVTAWLHGNSKILLLPDALRAYMQKNKAKLASQIGRVPIGVLAFMPEFVAAYVARTTQSAKRPFEWRHRFLPRHQAAPGQSFVTDPALMNEVTQTFVDKATKDIEGLVVWAPTEIEVTVDFAKPWVILPPTADLEGALLISTKRK